ncbi:MAG: hypothetical protein ACHQWU_15550, partial [Gemmatimonadales bacterium]
LPQLTQGKGSTIFLPAEAAGVIGALGGIRTLLARDPNAGSAPDTPSPGGARPGGAPYGALPPQLGSGAAGGSSPKGR